MEGSLPHCQMTSHTSVSRLFAAPHRAAAFLRSADACLSSRRFGPRTAGARSERTAAAGCAPAADDPPQDPAKPAEPQQRCVSAARTPVRASPAVGPGQHNVQEQAARRAFRIFISGSRRRPRPHSGEAPLPSLAPPAPPVWPGSQRRPQAATSP